MVASNSTVCSYIANRAGATAAQPARAQVFGDGTGISIDYLSRHDGSDTTIMLSERLLLGQTWGIWSAADPGTTDTYATKTEMIDLSFKSGVDADGANGIDTMKETLTSRHGNGCIVTFCDGHVRFLRNDITTATFDAICSPNGNELVSEADYE
jgi:prepilin-type processing-associated H-X9-DG protein